MSHVLAYIKSSIGNKTSYSTRGTCRGLAPVLVEWLSNTSMLSKASRSVSEGITPRQATHPYRMAIHALYASLRACNRYRGVYSSHVVYTHRISSRI
nr:MAG TPA: hypothetical protein [Caudoviricetes sp.]